MYYFNVFSLIKVYKTKVLLRKFHFCSESAERDSESLAEITGPGERTLQHWYAGHELPEAIEIAAMGLILHVLNTHV
ncbi:hypothetical protein [Desulforhopalus singaporensis]|uniref:hypothetical protein n=1 Tax=Desulforhopalus singaporensis TaxID=91360 RepID=UPI000B81D3D0|nr:hypothetical protein [Desulforhopalus singaporensis]